MALTNKKLKFIFILLIGLGIFFRFANLEHRAYWIDEAFTSLRISGHLEREVAIQQLFDGRVVTAREFEKYQSPDPEKGLIGTIRSISAEDTGMTPLYFILARLWNQWFGSSIATTRSLSAFLSILVLPIVYSLCQELFESSFVGLISVVLVAISPFHLIYASQARPYSLWTLATVLSSTLLLKAMRSKTKLSWVAYALSVTIGLYSHLFFGLVAICHGVFVFFNHKFCLKKTFFYYSLASLLGFLLFIPWIIEIRPHLKQLEYVPTFTGFTPGSLAKIWLLNISRIFIDFNQCFPSISAFPCFQFSFYSKIALYSVIPLFCLVVYSFYYFYRQAPRKAKVFILILTGLTALILIIPDIALEVRRSVSLRYAVPCILGIEISTAFFLVSNISSKSSKFWQQKLSLGILGILISIGVIYCVTISQQNSWWDQGYTYHLEAVSKTINKSARPLVIYSMKSTYLAPKIGAFARAAILAHIVHPKVKLQFIVDKNNDFKINPQGFSDVFVYGMNDTLREYFKRENYILEPLEKHSMNSRTVLWKLSKSTQ